MLPVARRQIIKDYVKERKSATVTTLAEMCGVTDETIRRDLKVLEKDGVLMRTYGGAFLQDGVENLVEADLRTHIYVENKKKIADRCKQLVSNGDTIFVDNSTTCYYVAEALQDMRLTVLTNSLLSVNLLANRDNIHLISLGGIYCPSEQAFYGETTIKQMKEYFVDKAFLSCRSLSITNGVTDSVERWTRVRQATVERSRETYLVTDFSKFDHTSFIRICGYEGIDAIVTDKPVKREWHEAMALYDCRIIDE